MLQIRVGLSQKEITQMFFSMDGEQEGVIEINDLEQAIEEGSEADVMKQVATPILRQVGEALIRKSCMEKCQELATSRGSDMLSFDGFVTLIRFGHPAMTLSSIMRLWCTVDKCGKGGLGFANIPDLVSNILQATMISQPNINVSKEQFPDTMLPPLGSPKRFPEKLADPQENRKELKTLEVAQEL